jgi:hypothetical protein
MRKRFFGWLDAIIPENGETYSVKFSVCDGAKVRHYEVSVTWKDGGLTFTPSEDIEAAMAALARGPMRGGEAARLYWTGRIADELFGRLASSGLFIPIVPERVEYAEA